MNDHDVAATLAGGAGALLVGIRAHQPDPYLPDVLICRPERRDRVLEALRPTRH